ncbi:hypothetical protein FRB94_009960 [Tulasnella sp. JGI-2019a]|nr:hypothetical protein FRB94_009960 [Tulasnella sp. JGI-2019a]
MRTTSIAILALIASTIAAPIVHTGLVTSASRSSSLERQAPPQKLTTQNLQQADGRTEERATWMMKAILADAEELTGKFTRWQMEFTNRGDNRRMNKMDVAILISLHDTLTSRILPAFDELAKLDETEGREGAPDIVEFQRQREKFE